MRDGPTRLVIGALLVVCLGLLVGAIYPISMTSPQAANPADERFGVEERDTFHTTGSLVVDDETALSFESGVSPEGAMIARVTEPSVTTEYYRPNRSGPTYKRQTFEDETAASSVRSHISADDDVELLATGREGDHYTVVSTVNGSGSPTGAAKVIVRSLQAVAYHPPDVTDAGLERYRPRAGWYRAGEPYRVTDASGTVEVDPETNVVLSADVTWHVTSPAGSYLEYLLVLLTTDDPTTQQITMTFDREADHPERPSWVDQATESAPP